MAVLRSSGYVRSVRGSKGGYVLAKAIKDNTRLIYIETVGNPKNDILQYERIADIAHKNGMPVTVTTPILFKLIDYGIDIVVHNCTKFIGGHGTCIGGAIVDSGKFD